MARKPARITGPVLGLVLTLAAGPALADRAEELHQEGIFRYSTGKYQRSLQALRKALRLTKKPGLVGRIQLHIGLNHQVLGQSARATRAFRAALTADPTLILDPERFKPGMVEAFEKVRRSMKGTLVVTTPVPGAEVLVAGRGVGKTPYRGQHVVGRLELQVRSADGARGWSGSVVLALARTRELAPKLEPLARPAPATAPVEDTPATPPPPVSPPEPEPAAPGVEQERAMESPPAADEEPAARAPRIWTWVAAGTAVAALGVGIGFGVSANADYDEYQTTDGGAQRLEELKDSITSKATVANAMYITAGVVAAGAVALFFLEPRWTRPKPRDEQARRAVAPRVTGIMPMLGSSGAGLSLSARF